MQNTLWLKFVSGLNTPNSRNGFRQDGISSIFLVKRKWIGKSIPIRSNRFIVISSDLRTLSGWSVFFCFCVYNLLGNCWMNDESRKFKVSFGSSPLRFCLLLLFYLAICPNCSPAAPQHFRFNMVSWCSPLSILRQGWGFPPFDLLIWFYHTPFVNEPCVSPQQQRYRWCSCAEKCRQWIPKLCRVATRPPFTINQPHRTGLWEGEVVGG